MEPTFGSAAVLDLLLNRDNPRHTHKESQPDVISYLVGDEEVANLARHMGKHGINPLEVVAVFPSQSGELVVAEGNRRVCAAQLLTDPEKAPESHRARFRALSDTKIRDVSRVNIAQFPDYDTAQPWLQILHDGEQDGVGRKRWKPEQKARATTRKSTDALAVALTDLAADLGIISTEERNSVQISTVTRYLANPDVRSALRITSAATGNEVDIDVDQTAFQNILTKFYGDLRSKKLHSRSKTKDWLSYTDELNDEFGTATKRPSTPASGMRVVGSPSSRSAVKTP